MPYKITKLPGKNLYRVTNTKDGHVTAKGTTLDKAKAQVEIMTKEDMEGGALTSHEVNKFVKASYKKKRDAKTVGDYTLDRSLSSKKNKVYVDPQGKVVIANAGTSSLSDWSNNPSIALGTYKKTKRYKDVEKTQKKAIAKYGKENIANVAHSQSGEGVRILAKKGLSKQAVAVNPAIIGKKAGRNVSAVRSSGDVVSAFMKGPRKTIQRKTLNPLAEHSAPVLSRIDHTFGGFLPRPSVGINSHHVLTAQNRRW